MKKPLFILLSLIAFLAHAEEDIKPSLMETQETIGSPLVVPISVNNIGEVSFFKNHGTDTLIFSPTFQFGGSYSAVRYDFPKRTNTFSLTPITASEQWLETHRRRIEGGAGLDVLAQRTLAVGLNAYKGAIHKIVRTKSSEKLENMSTFLLPKELSEVESWSVGDYGSFDSYGAIEAYAGLNLYFIDLPRVTLTFQNEFQVEMKKISEDTVLLALSEGSLNKRRIMVGTAVANSIYSRVNGKRFSVEFALNLRDASHQELFKLALKGKIKDVQDVLPMDSQKLEWKGDNFLNFVGVPFLLGHVYNDGEYDLNQNGRDTNVSFTIHKNSGLLLSARSVQRFVYQTDKHLVLFWTTEMNKVIGRTLDRYFLSMARSLGLMQFKSLLPAEEKVGDVVSELGVTFDLEDLAKIQTMDQSVFKENVKTRCGELSLPCRNERNLNRLMRRFAHAHRRTSLDLGAALAKDPHLVYAIAKTLGLRKDIYFKFLNNTFESLEGTSVVAP